MIYKRTMNRLIFTSLLVASLCSLPNESAAQRKEYTPSPVKGTEWNKPGNLNPIIPGYFADPTIRKFGDTYYIYATTDGTGNGYGPAQVWVSKDFTNWKNVILNWPTTEVVWAPDVVQQPDGKYRYYYCEPCVISIGESDSPLGPWHNILGKPNAVMVPDRYIHNVITLDPQLFTDTDGAQYLYFTTWGIYDGFGCGVAKLNDGQYSIEDLQKMRDARRWNENAPFPIAADKFFSEKRLIPNTELKDVFEAPFVFKRNGVYYFTYSSGSCHTDTYRVQYATSTVGPMGPFEYKGELLTTNEDNTVHGPGHHSILEDDGHYYIVYHRHDIPKAIHGFNRQVCIDELFFNEDGTIAQVVPTHDGILPSSFAKKSKKNTCPNLAYGAKVTASSFYNDLFKPEHITDDNNATLWKALHCNNYSSGDCLKNEWVTIDLGEVKKFNQIWTQFEYATFFYQYRIETSIDGKTFQPYAIKDTDVFANNQKVSSANTSAGSPMIDTGEAKARYIKITIADTQKNGHFPAIWNVKVYNATKKNNPMNLLPSTEGIDYSAVEAGYPDLHKKDVETKDRIEAYNRGFKVVDINADDYAKGRSIETKEIANRCGGTFKGDASVIVEIKKGKYAFYFDGQTSLQSDFALPTTMKYNAPYSISAWVLNPSVGGIETVAEFTQRRNDLATIEFRQGTDRQNGLMAHNASFENFGCPRECKQGEGEWQHWTVSYDGYYERIYLNGKLVTEKNSFLMIRPEGNITLGASFDGSNMFSGYIHSLKFYDKPLTAEEIQKEYNEPSSTEDKIVFSDLNLSLRADVITPDFIQMKVVDKEGNEVRSGLLTYEYSISDGKQKNTKLCKALVTDDEGTFHKQLTSVVSVNPKNFNIIKHEAPTRLSAPSAENFNEDPLSCGAKVLEEITGDFVVQAKVCDFDGLATHKTPSYNEAGIILLESQTNFMQNGIFPLYNCGNMLTRVNRGRPQFPVNNGWDFSPWVQFERKGNLVHARRSSDGKNWVEMPGSPMTVNAPSLKVGIYQTTYTQNISWASISDFAIYQRVQ